MILPILYIILSLFSEEPCFNDELEELRSKKKLVVQEGLSKEIIKKDPNANFNKTASLDGLSDEFSDENIEHAPLPEKIVSDFTKLNAKYE